MSVIIYKNNKKKVENMSIHKCSIPSWKSLKVRKDWEQNQKVYESFSALWKTDDKEWMKQRRKDWKSILLQLNRLHDTHGDFNSIKKKNFTFFKNYFLTGKATPETSIEEMPYCLWNRDYLPFYMLLQLWFCPDHSAETLDYIKNNTYLRGEEVHKKHDLFESACFTYRRTYHCYSGKYRWTEEEGTTETNGPIFGDLEPRMMGLFAFNPDSIKKFEDINSRDNRNNLIESAFWEFFRDYHPKLGETNGYNPHNPILFLIDEYVRWGFPRDHGDSFYFDNSPMPHIIAYALIMYVVDTPDGRPIKQLEFSKELKQRITDGLPSMSGEAQTRWETAEKFYKDGGLKPFFVNYQL